MKHHYPNRISTYFNIFLRIYIIFLFISILFLFISNIATAATINRPPLYLLSNNGLAPLEVQYADSVSAVAFGDRLLTGLVGYLPY